MTYCVEHPSGKNLLMPVEMAEPNPRCYVCSEVAFRNGLCFVKVYLPNGLSKRLLTLDFCSGKQTPLVLELNTTTATMRDVLENVVKRKLGVSDPVIMQGPNLLHESGEDIEEDMVAYYTGLLDKVSDHNSLCVHVVDQ